MSNQVKLGHVLQMWLDMNGQAEVTPVTWITILDVVRGPLVQNKALAMSIYQYLKQQSSKCVCNYFNYHCTIRGISNINYIISQYYMEHNRSELFVLILTVSIILS